MKLIFILVICLFLIPCVIAFPYCGDGICNNDECHGCISSACPGDCDTNFPNFEIESEEFNDMMEDIPISKEPTSDFNEIIDRAETTLRWMADHYYSGNSQDENNAECRDYRSTIANYDGSPSPSEFLEAT